MEVSSKVEPSTEEPHKEVLNTGEPSIMEEPHKEVVTEEPNKAQLVVAHSKGEPHKEAVTEELNKVQLVVALSKEEPNSEVLNTAEPSIMEEPHKEVATVEPKLEFLNTAEPSIMKEPHKEVVTEEPNNTVEPSIKVMSSKVEVMEELKPALWEVFNMDLRLHLIKILH